MTVEKFIKLTEGLILKHDIGHLSLQEVASKINPTVAEYPFNGPAHPMVFKVADLAFDIAENYRSEEEDNSDWALLKQTLQNYVSGEWEQTCWILTAIYGHYTNNNLNHSYSIVINRQNGKTLITTASKELRLTVNKLLPRVNKYQTDERYLQNLVLFLPKSVKGLKLVNYTCQEYLTNPYYSTKL